MGYVLLEYWYRNVVSSLMKNCLRFLGISSSVTPVKLAFSAYQCQINHHEQAPLVIAHGLFGSKQNWNSLCKAYVQKNPSRKVYAVDLRNHGESTHSEDHSYSHLAEDIRQFLIDNALQKVALMGHSMGGRCAMLFALRYPEFLEKLIIVDISPYTMSPDVENMPRYLKLMQSVELPKNVPPSQARAIVESQLASSILDKNTRAFILTNLVSNNDNRFDEISAFPSVSNFQYTGKTLFIGGENSTFIPKSDYSKIKTLFPNAKLSYIEGAGHWVHAEKPNEFLKMTSIFLNEKP